MGMPAVALTDHGQMLGLWHFYKEAMSKGVKPILGVEAYVTDHSRKERNQNERRYHLTLLSETLEGYHNLCRMISLANIEGFYHRPRVDYELLEQYSKGIIALSGCLQGQIPALSLAGRDKEAREAAERYASIFPGSFYLELQENDISQQSLANEALVELAQSLSLPTVATNDCHYLLPEHHEAHDILLCIQTAKTKDDPHRMRLASEDFYFKSPDEMIKRFAWRTEAIDNSLIIAERCQVEFPKKKYRFPNFPNKTSLSLEEILINQTHEGLNKRLMRKEALTPLSEMEKKTYLDRLDYEVKVINQMGFASYFLIVAEFINWAKNQSIPVGPGRGSAVGSLAAYCLNITDVDPIQYDLLFERFLNVERISMPDIDVDFCAEGRAEVIKHVTETYGGPQFVAQIVTIGQLKAKAVVRDVGRALGISLSEVNSIAKMIPDKIKGLQDALDTNIDLKLKTESDPILKKLITYALLLENLPRHTSTHASGVVIGDQPLINLLPVFCDSKSAVEDGQRTQVLTQYETAGVEDTGLIKFDFLGLNTLTLITHCLRLLKERGETPDLENLTFDDPQTFDLLSRGDVSGVFQMESSGIRNYMMRLRPSCLDDLIAMVALYRPGPLGSNMVEEYIQVKHGLKQTHYELELLKPILDVTMGVILYQEQVMRIAQVLAGFSLGQADGLRKAMGKKEMSIMEKMKVPFMEGAAKNAVPLDKAENIFKLMEKFAEYGFNKSHSAAYAVITYRTAWLKTHYPVEFYAALMTSEKANQKKITQLIDECRRRGFKVLPPDVNLSSAEFSVNGQNILFGLGAIKGVGQAAMDAIIEARKKEPFTDLFDFCKKASSHKVNRKIIEALINCGALDNCDEVPREVMIAALDQALAKETKKSAKKATPSVSLFSALEKPAVPAPKPRQWPKATPLSELERLKLEKELLGFYVTGDPLARFNGAMKALSDYQISELTDLNPVGKIRVCGEISGVKEKVDKNENKYCFATLSDANESVEITIWNKVYKKTKQLLVDGNLVMIEGMFKDNRPDSKFRPRFVVDDIVDLNTAVSERVNSLWVTTSLDDLEPLSEFFQKALSDQKQGTEPRTFIYFDIHDGLGQAIYKLKSKINLTVDFFYKFNDSTLPLSPLTELSCYNQANPNL
jgi:DNA polymerase-3 subunit alpha